LSRDDSSFESEEFIDVKSRRNQGHDAPEALIEIESSKGD
jgi:hypothetical protein